MNEAFELRRYRTRTGRDVLGDWLADLKDVRTRARIVARIDRLAAGNFGDCKSLRGGLFELRIDCDRAIGFITRWPADPVCCCFVAEIKANNPPDIQRAMEYLKDYWERTS